MAPYGWSYQVVTHATAPAIVSPLVLPSVRIAVGDLLL